MSDDALQIHMSCNLSQPAHLDREPTMYFHNSRINNFKQKKIGNG